jgi:hypothetical protein
MTISKDEKINSYCTYKNEVLRMARPKSVDPTKEKRIEIRLTAAELDTIDYVAKALGMSRSKAIVVTMQERADEIYRVREGK